MQGAQDLIGGPFAEISLGGKTYAVREPDLEAIAKVENLILELAYSQVEAMPERTPEQRKRKTAAINRLDERYIEHGAHKFCGPAFMNYMANYQLFAMMVWSCLNASITWDEFKRLFQLTKYDHLRCVRMVIAPFFRTGAITVAPQLSEQINQTAEQSEANLDRLFSVYSDTTNSSEANPGATDPTNSDE